MALRAAILCVATAGAAAYTTVPSRIATGTVTPQQLWQNDLAHATRYAALPKLPWGAC